ncbi:transposase [Streptosporangium sp. CA-135522]|uniref:transposase n=1 Tax=Streptosporangium sp. CA-135522 TaxID=3240072 RepID=UPI003D941D40
MARGISASGLTDPGVTVSRHRALVILFARRAVSIASGRYPLSSAARSEDLLAVGQETSLNTPRERARSTAAWRKDVYSRRVVGWSIDASQTATLVTNVLGMAVHNRTPPTGTLIHSDHGVQFTSWAFTQRVKDSGLVPSMGSIGDCFAGAVIESSRGRMQTELLNRRRWKTRIEPANAIFEYLEIFHNR